MSMSNTSRDRTRRTPERPQRSRAVFALRPPSPDMERAIAQQNGWWTRAPHAGSWRRTREQGRPAVRRPYRRAWGRSLSRAGGDTFCASGDFPHS
ncbi:hypothetical protein FKP32DRAFT_1591376 [Trametes sanguinea]|nr:hypothetical protein FKP32DRAFT_1591376 [Trametes sanguinea]